MIAARDPIFIGGLASSGKTQLRLVLGAHPEISMTRKTYLWRRYFGRFGDLGRRRNLERCLAALSRDDGVQSLAPDLDRILREFLVGPATYGRLFGLFHQHHAERHGKRRWGDQLGSVERFADPIFESFPKARMIQMIRDPRPAAAIVTGRRQRPGKVGWETAIWRRSAELAERNRLRYGDRYRVVRYENLAAHPEATVRGVCDFLGEDFVDGMAQALDEVRFDVLAGQGAAGEPRHSPAAFIEGHAKRELLLLDYPVATNVVPRGSSSMIGRPIDVAAMAVGRAFGTRHWPGVIGRLK
jgi:hypothetical protein